MRDHFFKENVRNNISKHIRCTILNLPIDQGTHEINNKDNTASSSTTTNDDDDDDDDDDDNDTGGVLPYKGLMGTCGQPVYIFRNFLS